MIKQFIKNKTLIINYLCFYQKKYQKKTKKNGEKFEICLTLSYLCVTKQRKRYQRRK